MSCFSTIDKLVVVVKILFDFTSMWMNNLFDTRMGNEWYFSYRKVKASGYESFDSYELMLKVV